MVFIFRNLNFPLTPVIQLIWLIFSTIKEITKGKIQKQIIAVIAKITFTHACLLTNHCLCLISLDYWGSRSSKHWSVSVVCMYNAYSPHTLVTIQTINPLPITLTNILSSQPPSFPLTRLTDQVSLLLCHPSLPRPPSSLTRMTHTGRAIL